MIRTTLLLLFVATFSIYAWKNWFVSLCSAILLLAVVEHPDFPKTIAGVPGLNPWNVLMGSVLLAWIFRRSGEGHEWDLPHGTRWFLWVFLAVVVTGVVRLSVSPYPTGFSGGYLFSELFVNTIKWVVPGLLLFDACRTRRRAAIALGVIVALYFLLALQVIRWMPLSEVGSGASLSSRASKITQNEIGYNRVTLSMMLSGASWAALAAIPMLRRNMHRLALAGVAASIAFGQALTGGRAGYVSWLAVGLLLALLRWRKLLVVIPVALAAIVIVLPGARDRMFQGFGAKHGNFTVESSAYQMTSGRDIAWPVVIEEIGKSPLIGHGRLGMVTTGARDYLLDEYRESFPHPHQAYLEQLLDNGLLGFLLIVPFYFYLFFRSVPLVLERHDPLVCAIGCACFCLVLALLIGGFGGQTFYPREGSVGMWAAAGLALRACIEREHALCWDSRPFPDELPARWFRGGDDEEWEDDGIPEGEPVAWTRNEV
jgi:O-antigen ligase